MNQHEANQTLFDAAWNHIVAQGQPSYDDEEHGCKYRTSDGLGCAFAPSIKEYDSRMEGRVAVSLIREFGINLHEWARECDKSLAEQVQLAHDHPAQDGADDFLLDFKEQMRSIAGRFHLKVPGE